MGKETLVFQLPSSEWCNRLVEDLTVIPVQNPVSIRWEPHSHRMVEVGSDLWKSPGPISLLKQDHLEPVAQALEYIQGQRFYNLPAQPVSVLHHTHSKKMFPKFQMEHHVFQFGPIASHSVTGHCWKESGSVFSVLFTQVFIHIVRSFLSFSSPGWIVPALSLSS